MNTNETKDGHVAVWRLRPDGTGAYIRLDCWAVTLLMEAGYNVGFYGTYSKKEMPGKQHLSKKDPARYYAVDPYPWVVEDSANPELPVRAGRRVMRLHNWVWSNAVRLFNAVTGRPPEPPEIPIWGVLAPGHSPFKPPIWVPAEKPLDRYRRLSALDGDHQRAMATLLRIAPRKYRADEILHHVNERETDARLSNLKLLPERVHTVHHHKERKQKTAARDVNRKAQGLWKDIPVKPAKTVHTYLVCVTSLPTGKVRWLQQYESGGCALTDNHREASKLLEDRARHIASKLHSEIDPYSQECDIKVIRSGY